MAKKVRLEDIQARLGRSSQSSGGDTPERAPRPAAPAEDPSSAGKTLLVSALSVVLAIGAAAFLAKGGGAGIGRALMEDLQGPPPQAAYRSRVADACEPGWKDNRENRDQIHCYMTRDVARLCNPAERRALADKLQAFQVGSDSVDMRLMAATAQMALNTNVMAMGMAEARSRDPNLTEEQRAEQLNKTMDMAQGYMAPANKVFEDNVNAVSLSALVDDVQGLAEKGFLVEGDFSATLPKIVKAGLARRLHMSPFLCGS